MGRLRGQGLFLVHIHFSVRKVFGVAPLWPGRWMQIGAGHRTASDPVGQERSFRANFGASVLEKAAKALEALIVALPETAGSALYGMVDVLGATGTLWRQLVGTILVERLIRPRIVGPSREAFRCGNAIPVCPDLAIARRPQADIVIVPEFWLSPDDDMKGRYAELMDWLNRRLPGRTHPLFGLHGSDCPGRQRPPQRTLRDIALGLRRSSSATGSPRSSLIPSQTCASLIRPGGS